MICVDGGGEGGFTGIGNGGGNGDNPVPIGTGPSRTNIVTVTVYVPTCKGNSPDAAGGVCGAATTTGCPTPGDTRVWVYTRQFDRATGTYVSPWVKTPGAICIGPDAPGLDPLTAVIATVRRDFQHFPLEAGTVVTKPVGESLVNAVTFATTTADGVDVLTRTILGLPVVVHAAARSYVWHFGDGATQDVAAAGLPPGQVGHMFAVAGSFGVSLDIVYGGTFTVGSSPLVYDVQGTATIVGAPAALDVREARSQLEAGNATE